MDFIATCFVIFFSLIGFSVVVFFAALYCMETYVDIRDQKKMIDYENREFDKIVNRP